MRMITVRCRKEAPLPFPAFSSRSFRDLSRGDMAGAEPPDGFADLHIPVLGATLAESVYLSGLFAPPALCSGIGRCGLCRVRFLSSPPPALDAEREILSAHALDAGWRLACRHAPQPGAHVLVPAPAVDKRRGKTCAPVEKNSCSLAVDLGTTSVHWRMVGATAKNPPRGVMTNPQMGAGSDVVSRLAFASGEKGTAILRRLVVEAFRDIIGRCGDAGFAVDEVCVAANPAMTGIFLGLDTAGLARAPYALPCPGNSTERVDGLPPVYIPPLIAPFVGGDISAGYASLVFDPDREPPSFPFLLADLGTNGECVLALSPTEALAASLPMGPALEGINLAFGSQAVPGAVTDYALTPAGLVPNVMGETAPLGITATGYLSLLRILRASGLVGEDGLFTPPGAATPAMMNVPEPQDAASAAEPRIRLPEKMALYASDVEEILKVKAAFTLAVSSLLREASLPAAKLRRLILAGSLGTNAPVGALLSLGFLPPGSGGKVVLAGNTALDGAALFLRHGETREMNAAWARGARTLDLASDASFGENFARHMVFAWRS